MLGEEEQPILAAFDWDLKKLEFKILPTKQFLETKDPLHCLNFKINLEVFQEEIPNYQ